METVRKAVAGVPLSIAVDVRYDTPGINEINTKFKTKNCNI